jgi:hypothetical protein
MATHGPIRNYFHQAFCLANQTLNKNKKTGQKEMTGLRTVMLWAVGEKWQGSCGPRRREESY